MSYTILYRTLFLKLNDGTYIPFIEMGSNNVYESTFGTKRICQRRARDWNKPNTKEWFGHTKDQLTMTEPEIIAGVEHIIDERKKANVNWLKNPYDKNCNEYWTEEEVEKKFGYFSGLAVNGHWDKLTAQKLRNFFKKGIRQAINYNKENLRIRLWWYEKDEMGGPSKYAETYVENEEKLKETLESMEKNNIHPWLTLEKYRAEIVWYETQKRKTKKTQTSY